MREYEELMVEIESEAPQILIRNHIITSVNPAFLELFDTIKEEVLGYRPGKFQPESIRKASHRLYRERFQKPDLASEYDTFGLKSNGIIFPMRVEILRVVPEKILILVQFTELGNTSDDSFDPYFPVDMNSIKTLSSFISHRLSNTLFAAKINLDYIKYNYDDLDLVDQIKTVDNKLQESIDLLSEIISLLKVSPKERRHRPVKMLLPNILDKASEQLPNECKLTSNLKGNPEMYVNIDQLEFLFDTLFKLVAGMMDNGTEVEFICHNERYRSDYDYIIDELLISSQNCTALKISYHGKPMTTDLLETVALHGTENAVNAFMITNLIRECGAALQIDIIGRRNDITLLFEQSRHTVSSNFTIS